MTMTPGIFGAAEPTARYARIVWGESGSQITIDFNDQLSSAGPPERSAIVGSGVATDGEAETIWERHERGIVIITPPLSGARVPPIERFLEEWGQRRKQFEFYVTRTIRAWWGFDDATTFDNNRGNEFRNGPWTGTALTFADLTDGAGVTLPSAGVLEAALVSTLDGGSGNAFFGATEGQLVLAFKPSWAAADGAEHVILDCFVDLQRWKNRLRIIKRQDNVLHIVYADQNGAETLLETTPTWLANTEQTIHIEWGATIGALAAKLINALGTTSITSKKYPIVASGARLAGTGLLAGQTSGTPLGTETVMNAGPDTVVLGSEPAGLGGRGSGTYGMLAIYRATFDTALPVQLQTFAWPFRTYFPRAELVDPTIAAVRITPAREFHRYQFRIRDGR